MIQTIKPRARPLGPNLWMVHDGRDSTSTALAGTLDAALALFFHFRLINATERRA